MIRTIFFLFLTLFPASLEAETAVKKQTVVVLQGLDKITGRIQELKVPLGQPISFGYLKIIIHKAYKAPPEDPPESAAFIEIYETSRQKSDKLVFKGWMFASSPSLAALEHPIFDVVVKDCEEAEIEDVPTSFYAHKDENQ